MALCLYLYRYFEWVRQIQGVVLTWQSRILLKELNYDDIILYALAMSGIQSIGNTVSATSAAVESHTLEMQKKAYLACYEQLNILLLRYIPGKPEAKWCTLSMLLAKNGVLVPKDLHDTLTDYVLFPGERKEVVGGLLGNEVPSSTTGQFNAGYDISLKLSKKLMLKDLNRLVDDLLAFLRPILDHIDMLVFFHLHHSHMFDKYLKVFLEKEAKKHMERMNPTSTLSTFGFSIPRLPAVNVRMAEVESEERMKLTILVRSLDQTKELLIKLVEGNATYNEIIAEGKLDVEKLDIDQEFNILGEFILHLKHTLTSREGLIGVRNMLELFQYTKHIEKIHSVCDQYKLKGCLEDPNLKQLVEIAKELAPKKCRHVLTLNETFKTMKRVKRLLFGKQQPPSHCLKLFQAVADSTAFYHFIKDKGFGGEHGQAVFTQQYLLITAHLQYEEYDEQVLNHLFAAFKFMTPFMNVRQDFKSLMAQVVHLDTSHGLKQLETVNSNITLIQLWFSRAEVSS